MIKAFCVLFGLTALAMLVGAMTEYDAELRSINWQLANISKDIADCKYCYYARSEDINNDEMEEECRRCKNDKTRVS